FRSGDAGNYTIADTVSGNIGIITPAALTISAVTDTRVYNGGTSSSGTPTASGLFGTDSVTNLSQTFASKNVMGANGSTLNVATYPVTDTNTGGNSTA